VDLGSSNIKAAIIDSRGEIRAQAVTQTPVIDAWTGAFDAGDLFTDPSNASATGLWDLVDGQWSGDLLDALGLDEAQLPKVLPAGASAGQLAPSIASETGLPAGVGLFLGGGDHQCALHGAGVVGDDECLLSLGTSAALLRSIDPLEAADRGGPGVLSLAHVVPDRWVCEGFNKTFGSSIQWGARLLGFDASSDLERMASGSGAEAPIFVPFLAGVGTPEFDDVPRGALLGASLSTGPSEMARAILDGLVFELRRVVEVLSREAPIERLRVVGGGSGPLLLRGLADCTGLEVVVSKIDEAALCGAAALAWRGMGVPEVVRRLRDATDTVIAPRAEALPLLEARYQRYLRALDSTIDFAHRERTK
jgi:xylulokinase